MVCVIFGGQVFCQLVNLSVLSKDLLNSEPSLCNPGYAPDIHRKTFMVHLKTMKNVKVHPSKSFHFYGISELLQT